MNGDRHTIQERAPVKKSNRGIPIGQGRLHQDCIYCTDHVGQCVLVGCAGGQCSCHTATVTKNGQVCTSLQDTHNSGSPGSQELPPNSSYNETGVYPRQNQVGKKRRCDPCSKLGTADLIKGRTMRTRLANNVTVSWHAPHQTGSAVDEIAGPPGEAESDCP